MDKITFTLKEIRKHSLCESGWEKLNETLGSDYGDETPITIKQIIDSNGLDDALWCLQTTPEETHYLWRHFAVDCVEQVKHLMTDERSSNALEVARRHADGHATDNELATAEAAARTARAARAAARDARVAASAAASAAASERQSRLLIEYCKHGKRPEAFE